MLRCIKASVSLIVKMVDTMRSIVEFATFASRGQLQWQPVDGASQCVGALFVDLYELGLVASRNLVAHLCPDDSGEQSVRPAELLVLGGLERVVLFFSVAGERVDKPRVFQARVDAREERCQEVARDVPNLAVAVGQPSAKRVEILRVRVHVAVL